MNELIYAALKQEQAIALTSIPIQLLTDKEKRAFRWIFKYTAEYGKVPSVERFEGKFPHFLLIETEDPALDVMKQKLEERVRQKVLFELDVARSELKEGPLNSTPVLNALRYLAMGHGFEQYESFDRTGYDRHKTDLATGFRFIDKAISFIGAGEVLLLIGRLGLGKTTLMCWIIHEWIKTGANVLIASAEMLTADLFAKLDSILVGINPKDLRIFPKEHIKKIDAHVSMLYSSGSTGQIFIPNMQVYDVNMIGAMATNLGVNAIALDGVYLMSEGGKYAAHWERVTAVSRAIKAMAGELKIPVLETSQAKRGSRELDDESASYADALAQDADFVLGLQPEKFKEEITLKLLKNRFGPKAETIVKFDWERGKVIDVSASLSVPLRETRRKEGQLW